MSERMEKSMGLVDTVEDLGTNTDMERGDGEVGGTGKNGKEYDGELEENSCWPKGMVQRLLEEDWQGYGPWNKKEKISFAVSTGCMVVCFTVLAIVDNTSFIRGGGLDWQLWVRVLGQILAIHMVNWILGYFVVTHDLHVGFSRKIAHFILYASPLLFYGVLDASNNSKIDTAWSSLASLVALFASIKPVRRRVPLLSLIPFMAYDRKEDRPHTIEWLALQTVQMLAIGFALSIYLDYKQDAPILLAIPLIITAVGDGLAEPVGVVFGTHKFVTPAIWYKGKFWSGNFTRSLEGSAAVFIVSAATVAGFSAYLNTVQLILCLCLMPPIMTVVEGYAPHTCDNPVLFLVGSIIIICVIEFAS